MRIFAVQIFVGGLVSAAGWTVLAGAQLASPSSVPVLKPRITVVGEVSDATVNGAFLPNDAAVSPNGKLIVYSTRGDLRVIAAESATPRVIFHGSVHTFMWGDKGDALTLTYDDPRTRTRDIYVLHVDADIGAPVGPAVKVADGPVNHGVMLSPDESLVAYARPAWDSTRRQWSDSRAELAVAPANGGPVRQLVAAQDLRVRGWSADGRTLYFHGFPDPSSKKDELRSISVDGGTPTSLGDLGETIWPNHVDPLTRRVTAIFDVPQGISITDWSPRNAIAGVRLTRPRGLRIINLDDGTTRDLTGLDGEVGIPDWFASGTKLAFIERRDDILSLVTMNADGSARRAYSFTTPPRFDGVDARSAYLQVSPDGNYAAFLGESRETLELLDLRSGVQRRLVNVQADASAPEGVGLGQLLWNADSKSIRYISGIWAPPRRAVREVTLAGEDRIVLPVPDPAGSSWNSFAFFPTDSVASPGRGAQVVELADPQHLAVVPYSGGPARTIYTGQVRDRGSLSPDGRTLAIRDVSGEAQKQVTLVSVDDGRSRVLPHPFIHVPGIAWHPDGKHLLIMGRDAPDGPVSLYSVPIDGAAPRVIAPMGSNRNESVTVLSPDGKRVAVTVGGTPTATFVRLDYDLPAKGHGARNENLRSDAAVASQRDNCSDKQRSGSNRHSHYRGNMALMALAHSKVTAQGQVSVPAKVRQRLGVGPGSVLEWDEEGDRVVVRRAGRYSSEDIHRTLFSKTPRPRTLDEMKNGIRQYIKKRHAGR